MSKNPMPTSTDSRPTLQELANAADELAPLVRDNAVRCEELRDPIPEVVEALKDAGLHRIYRPLRYGGYGLDWGPHFTVGFAVGFDFFKRPITVDVYPGESAELNGGFWHVQVCMQRGAEVKASGVVNCCEGLAIHGE